MRWTFDEKDDKTSLISLFLQDEVKTEDNELLMRGRISLKTGESHRCLPRLNQDHLMPLYMLLEEEKVSH
jgi:hypothetical protein